MMEEDASEFKNIFYHESFIKSQRIYLLGSFGKHSGVEGETKYFPNV